MKQIYYPETTTPLGSAATFTGPARDIGGDAGSEVRYSAFVAYAFADMPGTMRIECSNDMVTWRRATSDTTISAGATVSISAPAVARYFRVVFVNGGTAQGSFMLNTAFTDAPQVPINGSVNIGGSVSNTDNIWYQENVGGQAAGATVTGTSRDTTSGASNAHRYSAFNAFAFADQAGTVRIEISTDGTNWRRATADTAVAAGTPVILSIPVMARYHRVVFVNGGTASTVFLLTTSFTAA